MGLKIAIDTNRYSDFARGVTKALETFQAAEHIFVPLIVLAELRAGFAAGSKTTTNERNLARFLSRERVSILNPDEETTHHYARLFTQLRRQGTPIPTNDLWIAALVTQKNLHLFARDHHFDHLPQICRI